MHSSHISKIRILKTKKKSQSNAKISQIYTIKNDNYHASLHEQVNDDPSPPPPLVDQNEQKEIENNNASSGKTKKWVPVYRIVNMPTSRSKSAVLQQAIAAPVTSHQVILPVPAPVISDRAVIHIDRVQIHNSQNREQTNSQNREQTNLQNREQTNLQNREQTNLQNREQTNLQNREQTKISNVNYENKVSNITNKELNVTEPISCFLCHIEFETVDEMQTHYLNNHKQKKKLPSTELVMVDSPNNDIRVTSSDSSMNTTSSVSQTKRFKHIKPKMSNAIIDNNEDSTLGEPKCPICSIYFKTKDEVKEHMATVHCYKCSDCKDSFYTLYQFTDHRCAANRPSKIRKKMKKSILVVQQPEKDPLSLSPSPKLKNADSFVPKSSMPERQVKSSEPVRVFVKPILDFSHRIANEYPPRNESDKLHQSILSKKYDTGIHNQTRLRDIYEQPGAILAPVRSNVKYPNYELINQNTARDSFKYSQNKPNITFKATKSLLSCSFEELTSKEFNKLQLNELTKNPSLSVDIVPHKNKLETTCSSEFLSCGRCNVLCDNALDFIHHLQECLRLSNVSLHSTIGPPRKILNLNVKRSASKLKTKEYSGINKKLLDQVGSYINLPSSFLDELPHYSLSKQKDDNVSNTIKSNYFVPCIKGNVSINKCTINGSSRISNAKPPMVIIPINSQFNQFSSKYQNISSKIKPVPPSKTYKYAKDLNEIPPEISIFDKNSHVTYNFSNSEESPPIMSISPNPDIHDPLQTFIKVDEDFDDDKEIDSTEVSLHIRENLTMQATVLKNEIYDNVPINRTWPLEDQSPKVSLDMLLCEDEIKMEVEEQIVTDNF